MLKETTDGITRIPEGLKCVMVFIDRVGFPVLAFLLMFWIAYMSTEKMSKVIADNTGALIKLSAATETFQAQVLCDHRDMLRKLELR